jgi:hypothetical protein
MTVGTYNVANSLNGRCHRRRDVSVMTLDQWADLGTVAAVLFAAGAVAVSAAQTRNAAKSARANIWLELEKMFAVHDDVHQRLRPGGSWWARAPDRAPGPNTVKEWASLEDYMGLFEHCEIMMQQRLLDWYTFERIYSYRLSNIMRNKMIVDAKLVKEGDKWQDFISLLRRLSKSDPRCLSGWFVEGRSGRWRGRERLTLQATHQESSS